MQHNKILGKCYTAKQHRKQVLSDLSTHAEKSRTENKVKDFALVSSMNEYAGNPSILNFISKKD